MTVAEKENEKMLDQIANTEMNTLLMERENQKKMYESLNASALSHKSLKQRIIDLSASFKSDRDKNLMVRDLAEHEGKN